LALAELPRQGGDGNHYTDEISLSEALDADIVRRYDAKKTGEKFLINPTLAL